MNSNGPRIFLPLRHQRRKKLGCALAALRHRGDWPAGAGTDAELDLLRGGVSCADMLKQLVGCATDQTRALLDSVDTSTVIGLRDRALIGVMTYA